MTDLSIIIPSWNTAKATVTCLKTILHHLPKSSFEIIVVDNGSTDDTLPLIKQLIRTNRHLKLISNQHNLGFSKACNQGAKMAIGQYLFFLNSDMELLDSTVMDAIDYLKAHPTVGLIGPQLLNTDLSPQGSVFPPQTAINAFRQFWLNQSTYSKYTPRLDQVSNVWAISGGAVIISQKIFKLIGGWDERYFFYYEDLELCRQVRHLNLQIAYFPMCRIVHHHGLSGKTLATTSNQWRRLIPSSIIYHGRIGHYLINSIIWASQKWRSLLS